MKNPVLIMKEVLDPQQYGGRNLRVEGGLHYIKGNISPYFSLTCSYRNGGGAAHDLILRHFPQFADLAALHLSDVDGAPMYALENGFYHMGGTDTFGKHNPPNWTHAASHFRLFDGPDAALMLAERLFGVHYSTTAGFLSAGARADAKARLASWVDTQRPRWREEADACIRNHGLIVYGDTIGTYKADDDAENYPDAAQLAHVIADRIREDRA